MSAQFELRGNGAGAVDLIRQLNQKLDETEKQGGDAAKKLARMREAAERLAAQGSPTEQYAQKIRKLAEYLDKGAISQEKAEAAANRLRQQLEKSNPKVQEAAKRQKELADASERTKEAMRRQGEALKQSLETPLERYKRSMLEVSRLYRSQAIDDETRIRRTRELRRELEAATRATQQQATAQRSAFGPQAVANLKSYLTGMVGVSAIVAAVRSEFGAIQSEANRISQTQLDAAGARRALRTQIAAATPAEREFALAAADRLAPELSIPQRTVDLAIKSAISASPSVERGVNMAEFGLRLTKGTGDSSVEIGGAIDIANALETDNAYRAYAVQNITQQTARVTETAKVAKNAPRVINAFKQAGASPEEGAAFYAGLTVGGADPDSEVSRTAGINFIDRINKFFTRNKFDDIALEQRDEFKEQLALIMSRDDLAEQFVKSEQFQFRAASRTSVQEILRPESQAREAYNRTIRLLGDAENQEKVGRQLVDYIGGGKFEPAAETGRVIESGSEQRRLLANYTLSDKQITDVVETVKAARLARNDSFTNPSAWNWVIRSNLATSSGPTLERDEATRFLEAELAGLQDRADQLERAGSLQRWVTGDERERIEAQLPLLQQMVDSLNSIDRKSNAPTRQPE